MCLISLSILLNTFIAGIPTVLSASFLVPRGSVRSGTNSTISATVLDHAGHDITSSFQIRVYHPEAPPNIDTNTSLSNRQVSYARGLYTCATGGIFVESFCTPEDNKPGSLQSYTIICHHVVPAPAPSDFPAALLVDYVPIGFVPNQAIETRRRDGHCAEDEICVPGIGAGISRSGRRMASCVRTEFFVKYISWGDNDEQGSSLEGMKASMVASKLDGTTPLEVDTFEVDTKSTASSDGQKKKCKDCMELETDRFDAKTEGLKVQTTLLTTGAMVGVLWLAIMSG